MTHDQAAERMRLAIVAGVLDCDDVITAIRNHTIISFGCYGYCHSGETAVAVLNELLGENNELTAV